MNTQENLTSVLASDLALTEGRAIVENHFDKTLDFCSENWSKGNVTLVLPGNMIEFYGEAVIAYLKHCLGDRVGGAVAVTTIVEDNALKTLVQMPERNHPQLATPMQPEMFPATDTSVTDVAQRKAAIACSKGPPRPMNKWMLYRDSQYKVLKVEQPDLTVQKISKICSERWRNLTPEEKAFWDAAGARAAEEHDRLYPGYKYNPRKPGEKKKRQSRKAKQAAAAAVESHAFSIAPAPEVNLPALDSDIDFGTAPGVNSTIAESDFTIDLGQFTGPLSFFGLDRAGLAIDSEHHDVESLRQDRLGFELEAALTGNNTFEQVFGDVMAFRAGADGNATLPAITSDDY
uniref:Mating type 2 protein n=3 Tax=Phaeosphaeriaceae TaxID=5020 RepID=Q6XRY4_PHAND|nr:mating type 2 protein [Parastagonospora nodorum]